MICLGCPKGVRRNCARALQSALARRLGCSRRSVRRLLDVDARSRLHDVEAALRRIGEQIPLAVSTAYAGLPTRRVRVAYYGRARFIQRAKP